MSHFLKHILIEMIICIFALVSPTERCLTSKCICYSEFFPHHHPCCRFFWFLHTETAVFITKQISILIKQTRKNSLLKPIIRSSGIAITKNILLPTMSMQINDQKNLAILLKLLDHLLKTINTRLHLPTGLNPAPIKINPREITPSIPINNPVWIQHWDNLENKVIP